MRYALHGYFRSSTSWRARIGLHWKGIPFDYVPVHLTRDGGEQHTDRYRALNPMREVPTLVVTGDDGREVARLAQSIAILEYLEEVHPERPLLPRDPIGRARVRQIVEGVNSGIHPLQNLKVKEALGREFGAERERQDAWCAYWIDRGFRGLEALVSATAGRFAFGDDVTLADVALVPQMANARRYGVDLGPFPTLVRVEENARGLEPFDRARPERQPDAE